VRCAHSWLRALMEPPLEGKDYSFPAQEELILQLWNDLDAFQEQLKRTEGKPEYIFYDGPPFATGLPHYGHILAGTLKVASGYRGRMSHQWQLSLKLRVPSGHRHPVRQHGRPPRRPSVWLGLPRASGGARDRQDAP
jgi:hypothetical protein